MLWNVTVVRRALLPTAFALLALPVHALAQLSDAQIREDRRDILASLAQRPADFIGKLRQSCAAGDTPRAVAKLRSYGGSNTPDAADECAAVLQVVGQRGQLLGLYRQVQQDLGGAPTASETLPVAIGTAVVKAKVSQVDIGNGRAAVVSSSLALDAGFTVAFTRGEAPGAGMPDMRVLKPIAERCLAHSEPNLALCYSTGHVYGARAVAGLPITAP